MQSQAQVFQNEEFGKIEVLMIDGKPYFSATESAKILGYKNPRDAIAKHCRGDGVVKCDRVSSTTNQHGVSTNQTVEKTYINEGNLYRLIIRSRLPAAVRFETVVFDEILPSIRQHGAYIDPEILEKMQESLEFAEDLLGCLATAHAKNSALMDYTDKLFPKAAYHDAVLQSPQGMPISVIAKDYDMTALSFNKLLHELGVQYKVGGTWVLYAKYANQGYTVSKTYQLGDETTVHTQWTQLGRRAIYDLLCWHGIYPNTETIVEMAA